MITSVMAWFGGLSAWDQVLVAAATLGALYGLLEGPVEAIAQHCCKRS